MLYLIVYIVLYSISSNFLYFSFELVEECPEDKLDSKETEWITKFGYPDRTKIFNNESGGHKNKHLSQETKDKISIFPPKSHINLLGLL